MCQGKAFLSYFGFNKSFIQEIRFAFLFQIFDLASTIAKIATTCMKDNYTFGLAIIAS